MEVEPESGGDSGAEREPENGAKFEENFNVPGPEKINQPLIFSGPPEASQAGSPLRMKYQSAEIGRKLKFYETIDLLEMYHAGDTRQWNRLDEQMRRYYRREYPEYFGRDSKAKQEARANNKVKAARIRHERFQREARTSAKIPAVRTQPIDFQSRRKQVSGG